MTGIWTNNTRYFIKLPQGALLERLGVMLVEIMGYDSETEWELKDVARCIKYLENNEVAIDIQISNSAYINEGAVLSTIDSEMFDLAKYYFQVNEFLTIEEYRELKDITNINLK